MSNINNETKEKIKHYIINFLNTVYCDTCENRDTDMCCLDCHRKHMHWAISEQTAETMTNEITDIIIIYEGNL